MFHPQLVQVSLRNSQ